MKRIHNPDFSGEILICPYCGAENLHQQKVEVFLNKEDWNKEQSQKVCGHITIGDVVNNPLDSFDKFDNSIVVDNNMSNNPSYRRQGILIHFSCENCERIPLLGISQNEGSTMVEWMEKE